MSKIPAPDKISRRVGYVVHPFITYATEHQGWLCSMQMFLVIPDRLLETELINPKADGVTVGPCRPAEASLPQHAMQSPKTPVTAEDFALLQILIVQQDTTCCLNRTTR